VYHAATAGGVVQHEQIHAALARLVIDPPPSPPHHSLHNTAQVPGIPEHVRTGAHSAADSKAAAGAHLYGLLGSAADRAPESPAAASVEPAAAAAAVVETLSEPGWYIPHDEIIRQEKVGYFIVRTSFHTHCTCCRSVRAALELCIVDRLAAAKLPSKYFVSGCSATKMQRTLCVKSRSCGTVQFAPLTVRLRHIPLTVV
jgi:hypothetical protein